MIGMPFCERMLQKNIINDSYSKTLFEFSEAEKDEDIEETVETTNARRIVP
jgi:hypothetical protein